MIRWPGGINLPIAGFIVDMKAFECGGERRRHPDMVKAAAAVGFAPVAVAVAPPAIEFLLVTHKMAADIAPVERGV